VDHGRSPNPRDHSRRRVLIHFVAADRGIDVYNYPRGAANTIINVCHQGQAAVVERFGKFHKSVKPGLFFALPLIDRIAYVVDTREMTIGVEPQPATSKDNVSLTIAGTVYVQTTNVEAACYKAKAPLLAVVQHAQSALRAAVGQTDLDELFHNREKLNAIVTAALNEPCREWGFQVRRFEILDIRPDNKVAQAMDLQAVAERERRERVLRAEAEKKAQELGSEGKRLQEVNESEGQKQRAINISEGDKQARINQAEAEARAVERAGAATANAVTQIATALKKEGPEGARALEFLAAIKYLGGWANLAQKSTTMIIPQETANGANVLATAGSVMKQVGWPTPVGAKCPLG
jgi:regulator of protease activity HflC (stomatin/prohibitin superfamily)